METPTVELELDLLASKEQREILECKESMQVLVSGRRWGKTTTARNKMVQTALALNDGEIVYLAPSYRRSLAEYRAVFKVLREFVVEYRKQPPPEMRLDNGTRLSFLSFDKGGDNLRGDPADLIVADEAAKLNGELFWDAVQPMTADRPGAIIFLCSTFRGKVNWFYDEYQKGLRKQDSVSWLYPTRTGVAFQGEAGQQRLERIKRQVPKRTYDQEYDCIATVNERQAFPFIETVISNDALPNSERGHLYIQGLDLGGVVDHTASVVLDCTTGKVVAAKLWHLGTRHEVMAREAAAIEKAWGARTVIDCTGGASGGKSESKVYYYTDQMPTAKRFFWSPNANDAKKEDVIEFLELQIQNATISIPSVLGELCRQMRAYEGERRGRYVTFTCPEGEHDDYVSALAMAVWGRKNKWWPNAELVVGAWQ